MEIPNIALEQLKSIKTELTRFMMTYKFALDELNTKIDILKQEFQYVHDYNPIEHVSSRLKTPESIIKKVQKKGLEPSLSSIRDNIYDIAGIRITCSFISDIYVLADMLINQKDIEVVRCKDYIKDPKPNGYRSLHLILKIPIFMTDRVEEVCAEVQIRTIAMDFWASLEHKLYYKYNREVPSRLREELKEAANSATELDEKMEKLHKEIDKLKESDNNSYGDLSDLYFEKEDIEFPYQVLKSYFNMKTS